jgi:hypothetical protein
MNETSIGKNNKPIMEAQMAKTLCMAVAAALLFSVLPCSSSLPFPGAKGAYAQATQPTPEKAAKPKITFAGGPGDSFKTAIIIQGAKNSLTGVEAEYRYLEQKFGQRNRDWKLIKQSLIHHGGKHYDLMEIQLADGAKKQLYFDITEFFGKF